MEDGLQWHHRPRCNHKQVHLKQLHKVKCRRNRWLLTVVIYQQVKCKHNNKLPTVDHQIKCKHNSRLLTAEVYHKVKCKHNKLPLEALDHRTRCRLNNKQAMAVVYLKVKCKHNKLLVMEALVLKVKCKLNRNNRNVIQMIVTVNILGIEDTLVMNLGNKMFWLRKHSYKIKKQLVVL